MDFMSGLQKHFTLSYFSQMEPNKHTSTDSHYHSFTIAEALRKIEAHELALPLIQRNFVWDIDRITKLFDSILQGYPINSMLFWKVPPTAIDSVQMYGFIKNYTQYYWFEKGQSATSNGEQHQNQPLNLSVGDSPRDILAVLDGQQRLTSFYMALKGTYAEKTYRTWSGYINNYPPKALYLCVSDLAATADTLEAYRANRYQLKWRKVEWSNEEPGRLKPASIRTNQSQSELWLQVSEVMHGADLSSEAWADTQVVALRKYAATLTSPNLPEEDFEQARQILKRLHSAIHQEPYISYYLEEGEDLARAVETFIRINNGGMTIGYADLLFSILNSEWKNRNARNEVENIENTLRQISTGLNLEKAFILKSALVMVEGKNLRFELSQFSSIRVKAMESNWPRIAQALVTAGRTIADSNIIFLNTPALAIIVAYYWYKRFEAANSEVPVEIKDQIRIRQWLIRARLLWSNEKLNTETKISHLIRIISQHFADGRTDFPFQELIEKSWGIDMRVVKDGQDGGINLDELAVQPKYASSTKFLLGLLQTNTKHQVTYDIDHCYPFSETWKVSSENWSQEHEDLADSLPNLQLLPDSINRSKSDQHFHVWYESLPVRLLDADYQRELGVKTQAELHKAHFYPDDLSEAYEVNDTHNHRLAKFQRFYHARHSTTLARLQEVFQDPD